MQAKYKSKTLSLATAAASLLLLLSVSMLTNPLQNVSYVVLFLILLFIFLASLAYASLLFRHGFVGPKSRKRITLTSLALVSAIMLRSLQALGVAEAILITCVSVIMFFYLGRSGA